MNQDPKTMASHYISSMESALKFLERYRGGSNEIDHEKVAHVIESAKHYLSDAKYYFSIEYFSTSLASVSYSEGLLDGLYLLNLIEKPWNLKR